MNPLIAGALTAVIVLPHVVRFGRAAPPTAVAVWLSSLVSRAVAVLLIVGYLALYLPETRPFAAVTHWCLHLVAPLVHADLDVDGREVGELALTIPAVAEIASLMYIAWRVALGARSVRSWVNRGALGVGPSGSVIVPGAEAFVAAVGVRNPRVVVSAGALLQLDDEELAAGLAHERGHIARHHRRVMLVAELSRSLGRAIPGARPAIENVRFHLERDADLWALRRDHDPLALASAICKVAAGRSAPGGAGVSSLGEAAGLQARLHELEGADDAGSGARRRRVVGLPALTCAVATVAVTIAAPVAMLGSLDALNARAHVEHCAHETAHVTH